MIFKHWYRRYLLMKKLSVFLEGKVLKIKMRLSDCNGIQAKYRVYIHSTMPMWHNKDTQINLRGKMWLLSAFTYKKRNVSTIAVRHCQREILEPNHIQGWAVCDDSKQLQVIISACTGGLYFRMVRIYRKTFYREK